MKPYLIPAERTREEISVLNSRFIATLSPTFSVEEARMFIHQIKEEFPDAAHHVPAFVIGHGDSLVSHCSDDGEPSGTAGRPALAVLAGSGLGDAAAVVTRYFGGTKLGTGGLVRAYGDAVRAVLLKTPHAHKVPTHTIMIVAPYAWFERLRETLKFHEALMLDQDFGAEVTLTARLPVDSFEGFRSRLTDLSHGSLKAVIMSTETSILPVS